MLRLTEVKLPLAHAEGEIRTAILKRLGIADDELIRHIVFKRGVDARKPHAILFTYTLDVTVRDEAAILARLKNDPHLRKGEVKPAGTDGGAKRQLPQSAGSASNVSQLRFDKQHDIPGPSVIAMALQRRINDRDQRIVVVGNGEFLSNSYAGNGGNVDLGVNIVNWLAGEEHLITLQPRAAKDSSLVLSKTQLEIISGIFLLGLPLLLAGVGVYIWRKRRA